MYSICGCRTAGKVVFSFSRHCVWTVYPLSFLHFVGAFCRHSPSCSIWFRSSLLQPCGSSTPCVATLAFHALNTLAVSSCILRGLIFFSVTFIASHFSKSEATNTFPYHSSALLLLVLDEYFPCHPNTALLFCICLLAGPFLSSCLGLPTATSLSSFFSFGNPMLWFKYCPKHVAHGLVPLFANPASDTIYASEVS
jgi:hypothetical protein